MKKSFLSFIVLVVFITTFTSCDLLTTDEDGNLKYATGWNSNDEDLSTVEDDVNMGTSFGSGNLPESVDLQKYFPPIGNQGQYGTCVAWAVGYNHKSFLEAKVANRTNYADLTQIFSAKDLFWSIENSRKGSDCNGTSFQPAYDVMQSRGIATMGTVPYTDLGDCSGSPQGDWTSEANKHKIDNYREITVDKETIKGYLAKGRAVAFGAKLGEEFMNYTGGVLGYQSSGYSGQHGNHAMIIAGYDDNKGANGAFKVINSWGKNWGESGVVWVDQDYFCQKNKFCFCAFVATDSQSNPDGDGDNEVDDVSSGYDLVAWELKDQQYYSPGDPDSNDPRWRTSYYNVYNSGENTLSASKDWCIAYLLYNAYDGNDYKILLFDYYSDDYGSLGDNAAITDAAFKAKYNAMGYWYNYVNVKPAESVSHAVFGNNEPFKWSYKMPKVTGDYYLVIFADAFDTFSEADESNNFTYFTAANNKPLHIVNGVIQNAPSAKALSFKSGVPYKGQDADLETVRGEGNLNAYTTAEIRNKILYDRETGVLQQKIYEYEQNSTKTKVQFSK